MFLTAGSESFIESWDEATQSLLVDWWDGNDTSTGFDFGTDSICKAKNNSFKLSQMTQ